MKSLTLLKTFFGRGKLSTREYSAKMGRSHSFLSRYIYRESTPSADLLSEILDVIGWDLLARNRETNEEIFITNDDES